LMKPRVKYKCPESLRRSGQFRCLFYFSSLVRIRSRHCKFGKTCHPKLIQLFPQDLCLFVLPELH